MPLFQRQHCSTVPKSCVEAQNSSPLSLSYHIRTPLTTGARKSAESIRMTEVWKCYARLTVLHATVAGANDWLSVVPDEAGCDGAIPHIGAPQHAAQLDGRVPTLVSVHQHHPLPWIPRRTQRHAERSSSARCAPLEFPRV